MKQAAIFAILVCAGIVLLAGAVILAGVDPTRIAEAKADQAQYTAMADQARAIIAMAEALETQAWVELLALVIVAAAVLAAVGVGAGCIVMGLLVQHSLPRLSQPPAIVRLLPEHWDAWQQPINITPGGDRVAADHAQPRQTARTH